MTPKELKESKKLLEEIKSLQDDITKNSARYNQEGKLGVRVYTTYVVYDHRAHLYEGRSSTIDLNA